MIIIGGKNDRVCILLVLQKFEMFEFCRLLIGPKGVPDHFAEGVDTRLSSGQQIFHGLYIVNGHVQNIYFCELFALSSTAQHRVGNFVSKSFEGVVNFAHSLSLPHVGRFPTIFAHRRRLGPWLRTSFPGLRFSMLRLHSLLNGTRSQRVRVVVALVVFETFTLLLLLTIRVAFSILGFRVVGGQLPVESQSVTHVLVCVNAGEGTHSVFPALV